MKKFLLPLLLILILGLGILNTVLLFNGQNQVNNQCQNVKENEKEDDDNEESICKISNYLELKNGKIEINGKEYKYEVNDGFEVVEVVMGHENKSFALIEVNEKISQMVIVSTDNAESEIIVKSSDYVQSSDYPNSVRSKLATPFVGDVSNPVFAGDNDRFIYFTGSQGKLGKWVLVYDRLEGKVGFVD